eukprot:GHVQ01023725.1.p1 GENE.GHVQ01023725.1~~GHVQ01023725.1.p1  ORF type:complete len:394 (-),score=33.36 GHVQ01023725.1:3030-4058(-)
MYGAYGSSLSGGGKSSADISQIYERNQEATLYVGNLDSRVDEELLAELFAQCGPLRNVHIPRDKVTASHSNYGFVEYENELDSDYALKILNMIKLYGKPLRCNKASQDKRTLEVGANLFIGNLDPEVDDKLLYDTFIAFGPILSAKVMRDPDTGESKGFGFVSYDTFDASDSCLAGMNGQFLCNRPVHVSYAYKKDTKGERHGSAAERLIAANRPLERLPMNTTFANVPTPTTSQFVPLGEQGTTGFPPPPPLLVDQPSAPTPMPAPPPGSMQSPTFPGNRQPHFNNFPPPPPTFHPFPPAPPGMMSPGMGMGMGQPFPYMPMTTPPPPLAWGSRGPPGYSH